MNGECVKQGLGLVRDLGVSFQPWHSTLLSNGSLGTALGTGTGFITNVGFGDFSNP